MKDAGKTGKILVQDESGDVYRINYNNREQLGYDLYDNNLSIYIGNDGSEQSSVNTRANIL